jgi:integrase
VSPRTGTAAALPAVGNRQDWAEIVEAQLLCGWRPQEWNPELLLFTGLLDTSVTLVFTCSSPECGQPSRTKATPCYECAQELKTYTGDRSAFRRTHRANRWWTGQALPQCVVTHDGDRCQRTAGTRGLCRSHWSLWLQWRRRGATFEEFLNGCTHLYARRDTCRVVGCEHEIVTAVWGLCAPHDQQFGGHGKAKRSLRSRLRFDEFIVKARPMVRVHQFSLTGLPAGLRVEILYVLQRRDVEGFYIDPVMIRTVIKKCDERDLTSLLDFTETEIGTLTRSNTGQRSFLRSARIHLTRLQVRYGRQNIFDGDIWDAALLGLMACRTRPYPAVRGTFDFTAISLLWVKNLVKVWVRHTEPDVITTQHMIRAAKLACESLMLRACGHDPAQLRLVDMTAVVRSFNTATRPDGQLYSTTSRARQFGSWRDLLEFGRAAGLMNDVPGDFAVLSTHRIDRQEPEEERAGKSLPVAVIRVLDAHLDTLRPLLDRTFVGWGADDYALMYRTVYFIFRNTGRRLDEVMSLKRDCLRYNESGDSSLLYDNRKAKRLGRWLHIDNETAAVIERWQRHVDELPVFSDLRVWLFPSPGARRKRRAGHYRGESFLAALNQWKQTLPPIHYGGFDEDGSPRVFDVDLIHTHAFRHTYAQRHADAGTPVDVLRELMDHRSINTTMGYYQVSLKRKADAVRTVGALSVDRDGNPAPNSSTVAYESGSVAVPFGNCTEPSNVKSGGEHCPIRFQCSGCDFYRPDPSFLPAIEDQIAKLRLEREHAIAVNAAEWVTQNYDDQITAFKKIATAMKALIEDLHDQQRTALDEASAVLRRTRAARTYLPLTVVSKEHNHG